MTPAKYIIILVLLFFSAVFQNCSDSSPLEQKKLVKIYSDMLIMQDTTTLNGIDIQKKVLKAHNVPSDVYQNSIDYLKKEPERWQSFYDSVVVYLQNLKPAPKPSDVKILPKRSLSQEK